MVRRLEQIYASGDPGSNRDRFLAVGVQTIDVPAQLGFDMGDNEENFSIDFEIDTPPDLNEAADFILRALHNDYGARGFMNLEFNAPFAPRASSTSVPVNQQ